MTRWRYLALCISIICFAGYAGMLSAPWLLDRPLAPVQGGAVPSVKVVEIPDGASLRQVAIILEQQGLIGHRWSLILLEKLNNARHVVRSGEYALHAGMRPSEILAELHQGHVLLHSVTIPEGFTVAQIAQTFGQKGLGRAEEFERLAHDREFIQSLGLTVDSLEGYLYPDTYRFARRVSSKEILTAMVEGLRRVFTADLQARAAELKLTLHEVLTLASVIEKETGAGEERPFVSSVFHNRLRHRIPLQSDPTVIYGLKDFDGNIRKRDLSSPSPYNTYRVRGLPPGPIACPGIEAIRATLFPAPTKYLYFVSRNDGTHYFSATLAEHERAVDRFQRRQHRKMS
jgi:UPF0755 protein